MASKVRRGLRGRGAGTLTNFGTVRAEGTASSGVLMPTGGVVTNGGTADTTALIQSTGYAVGIGSLAGTVSNFGTIIGGYVGGGANGQASAVYLASGGVVTNGSAADTTARMGGFVGVYIKAATGTISNFGTIGGAVTGIGAAVAAGGVIVNGSATDTTALIQGYIGAAATGHTGTIDNFGTVIATGGPASLTAQEGAIFLQAGGVANNGSAADTKAQLTGASGIIADAGLTANNFGGIYGSVAGVYAVTGGKVTNGSATDTTATITGAFVGVDIIGAVGTVSNFGTINGGAVSAEGVGLAVGGTVIHGSTTDHAARRLIHGFFGRVATTNVAVSNFGTISGLESINWKASASVSARAVA